MGWSTNLFCNIEFYKKTYNSKYEVEREIEEEKETLQTAKDTIRNLAIMTEPNKFCPEEYDILAWIRSEVNDNLELIEECNWTLCRLYYLLENWDACHNEEGLAIDPPDNIKWNTAFLDGDFIRTVKNPDNSNFV